MVCIRGGGGHEIIDEAGFRSDTISNRSTLSNRKIRNRHFDHNVGLGCEVHPGFVDRQEGGAKKMTLRKLTLSVSPLATSLMLAAPVKVET